MPELVEELLAKHSPADGIYIARAYAHAAAEEAETALRERFFKTAAAQYRRLLALQANPDWYHGLRRRVHLVLWRLELADMILRYWAAPDLDRYEITSGLDYDRERITRMLHESLDLYQGCAEELDTLLNGLRTEEDRYLLLGLADEVRKLHERRRLNMAWASLYYALAGEISEKERGAFLNGALSEFDQLARSARDETTKYNVLIGAGMALRESQRFSEGEAAFDRVINSVASLTTSARARYELARLFIKTRRYAEARNTLGALGAMAGQHPSEAEQGAAFYVRLAPLVSAYTYIVEAGDSSNDATLQKKLQEQAVTSFATLADRSGEWPDITRIYLDSLAGTRRKLEDLSPAEIKAQAAKLMKQQDYSNAREAWQALLKRPEAKEWHAETRFNLGVCFFQEHNLRAAAEIFLIVAKDTQDGRVRERAAEYAYRTWQQLAQTSRTPEDYRFLAEACEMLAVAFPHYESVQEAVWIGALSRQESGALEAAITAYAKMPRDSGHYAEARRNMARCRQRQYEALPSNSPAEERAWAARSAAQAWLSWADELASDLKEPTSDPADQSTLSGPAISENTADQITEARLLAVTILARDETRAFQESLSILDKLSPTGRVVALRMTCYRGLGDYKGAQKALEDFLGKATDADIGSALLGLAAEIEEEIERLRSVGRQQEATRLAENCLPTFRRLLEWIQLQPKQAKYVPIVRFSLAKVLARAECYDETMALFERLIKEDSSQGGYVREAALLQEDMAQSTTVSATQPARKGSARTRLLSSAERKAAANKAEALWARLLEDRSLFEQSPKIYWEARYYWLRHQLRHDRASEVLKGIQSDKAWHPDLGGSPWQERLLKLAEQAQEAAPEESSSP